MWAALATTLNAATVIATTATAVTASQAAAQSLLLRRLYCFAGCSAGYFTASQNTTTIAALVAANYYNYCNLVKALLLLQFFTQ